MIDTNLLLSTILMLKKSLLKDYLFKIMINLNKLKINNEMKDKNLLNDDMTQDIYILLENMDDWIRFYNSSMRMSMKKELIFNLGEIKKMFYDIIE